jgi:hypothetical protein
MMQPDTRIPLAFQQPDFVNSIARGAQAGQFVNEARHQGQFRNALAQHGAGLVAGEDGARNALAGFDPGMVMQADGHRQGMQHNEQRLQLAYQEAGRKAQQLAMAISAQERDQLRAEFEQGADMIAAAQTPEQFAQVMQAPGVAEAVEAFVGPGMGTFENRQIVVAAARGAKDALALGGQAGPQSSAGKFFQDQAQGFIPEGVGLPSGVTVNTGDQGPRTGTIPPGMMLVDDPGAPGGLRMAPIAGGPAERAEIESEDQAVGRQAQRARAGATVIQDLQRGLDLIPELGAIARGEGVAGGVTRTGQARVPGTVANRITQFTESALSNVGLDTLQQMRENSPTGGALGQVPIQQQKRLEQVLGSLDISQPPSVLEANIKRVMNIYTDIIYGSPEERARAVEQGRMTQQQSAEIEGLYYELPFDERGRAVDERLQAPRMAPQQSGPSDDELLRMYGGD